MSGLARDLKELSLGIPSDDVVRRLGGRDTAPEPVPEPSSSSSSSPPAPAPEPELQPTFEPLPEPVIPVSSGMVKRRVPPPPIGYYEENGVRVPIRESLPPVFQKDTEAKLLNNILEKLEVRKRKNNLSKIDLSTTEKKERALKNRAYWTEVLDASGKPLIERGKVKWRLLTPEELTFSQLTKNYVGNVINKNKENANNLETTDKFRDGKVYEYKKQLYKPLVNFTNLDDAKRALDEDLRADKNPRVRETHRYRWAEFPTLDDLNRMSKEIGLKTEYHH